MSVCVCFFGCFETRLHWALLVTRRSTADDAERTVIRGLTPVESQHMFTEC